MNPSSGETLASDRETSVLKETPKFRFPLAIDPVRLLAGILTRWPWIAIGAIIFGTLGAIAGIQITKPSFAISVSLIKRRVPQTVQTSETGQAFRPVDLNDATLLATLLASEPLDLAVARAKNGVDAGAARALTEASQLEGTDIFYITYHSPLSPQDAVEFSAIWADEINAYTQRLQQTEAHEVRAILQKEVSDLENQIKETNLQILAFSREKGYLGGDTQVAAALGQLSQIDLQLETARTNASAKEQQLKNYNEQIRRQSPVELQLKTAKEELANLRATYTDANPLVQAKLQSIEYLNGQIATLGEKGEADLEAYTGTPLGNQIYLSILGLRNEYLGAVSQVKSLEELKISTEARLKEFPGIVSSYDALRSKRETITESLSLMSNRLKEAEIFASGAPGYWQIFQAPDPRRIIPSSMVKKPAMLGVAGGVFGATVAVLLTLLLTHRTSRRSILECCAAAKAPLISHIPISSEDDARTAFHHLWITYLAPRLSSSRSLMLWMPAVERAEEQRFWNLLAEASSRDTGKPVRVLDLTPDTIWSETPCPDTIVWLVHPSISSLYDTANGYAATVLRASSLPNGSARDALAGIDYWITLVAGRKDSLRNAAQLRMLTDAYLPPCNGTIAWMERPEGKIREAADLVSTFIAKRFS